MTGEALSIAGLTVAKAGAPILADVACAFPAGRLSVLVGPNGAGKSTLLRAVAGLEAPTAGKLAMPGAPDLLALAPAERARLVAWVPDYADMPFAFTVREVVLMGRFPWHQGTPRRSDVDRVEQAIAGAGLGALAGRPFATLSRGERQKAQVARGLAGDAPCLLFDEPTANLDVGAALQLLGQLRALAAGGRTVVVALHDLALAQRFADAAVCLAAGRVAAQGSPATVFAPATLARVFGVEAASATTADGKSILRFEHP